MNAHGWLQIGLYAAVIVAVTRPLGAYMHRVFEGSAQPFPRVLVPVERILLRGCGVRPGQEQTWREYTAALLAFSAFGVVVTYAIQRLQGHLPWNPQGLAAPSPHLAWN